MSQNKRSSSIHDVRYREIISLLVEARKSAGLSQAVLAEQLGFEQPDISKIERLERRLDIAEFLDIIFTIAQGDQRLEATIWENVRECYRRSQ